MDIGGIPVVISKGTPYEIGLNHGKSCPDRVRKSFEYNLKSCVDQSGFSQEEVYKFASGFIKPVERAYPDYICEVQGIADGAGLKLEDLMVNKAQLFLDEGYMFGDEGIGYERVNLACPQWVLKAALERLEKAVQENC